MNKNAARFALAAKCGWRGLKGFDKSTVAFAEGAACGALSKNPSRDSKSINASPAKPPPTSQRNSRRVRPQGVGLGENLVCSNHMVSPPENPPIKGGVEGCPAAFQLHLDHRTSSCTP